MDFNEKRFLVRASKTAHHKNGGVRVVPMFPELVDLFHRVFDEAPEGAMYVFTRFNGPAINLRTQFVRYIEAAGLKPWPWPWQNLRVSRATELVDLFPSHVCAEWLGHGERVADMHYRTVLPEHYERAVALVTATPEKAAQKAAQYPAVSARKASQNDQETAFCGENEGVRYLTRRDWARRDSNPRPSDYESPALTAELRTRNARKHSKNSRHPAYLQ